MSTEYIYPGEPMSICVNHRNLKGFSLSIYRINLPAESFLLSEVDLESVTRFGTYLRREHFDVPPTPDYRERTDTINLVIPEAGISVLVTEPDGYPRERKGFQVECVYDGETGKEYAELGIYDLLILDVMMPKMDGLEVARQVRKARCNTPILMLTARSDVQDRIAGLNAGADYYLTKPFDSGELLASINALLRRQGGQVNEMVFGNTVLDLSTGTLLCDGKTVRLSAKEFDVMRLLMQAGKRNLSKAAILSHIWGLESNAVENHVEVYVAILRKRLSSISSDVRIISIRGLGYHLEVKES